MSKLITHISGIDILTTEAFNLLSEISEIKYVSIISKSQLKKSLNKCDIFWFRLNHKLTREVLERAKCKYILCAVTGLDHIDIMACKEFGIKIVSLKNEKDFLRGVRATAEHTLGLILALIRKSKKAFNHVEQGNWNRNIFQGTELYGKKIGIFGFGRLGEIVAKYASVFGMQVFYYDIVKKDVQNIYYECNSPEELCSTVDFLSIHLPYNEKTHFILNSDLLSKMKSSSYIVNTARGGVVNENDLLWYLENSKIAGYATDVLYGEPNIKNHALIKYASINENVIITPHIAGNTIESIEKTEIFIVHKLLKLICK